LLKIRLIREKGQARENLIFRITFECFYTEMELKEVEYGFTLIWNILGYVGILNGKHVIINRDSSVGIVTRCRLDGQGF
jgi:hypothetical protein